MQNFDEKIDDIDEKLDEVDENFDEINDLSVFAFLGFRV